MKKLILAILLFFQLGTAQEKDIRIIQSDERGITFEYTPAFSEPSNVEGTSEKFTRFEFYNEVPNSETKPGSPALNFRNIVLRLQGVENHSVEILSADYENINNILITPAPFADFDPDNMFSFRHERDVESYSATNFLPEEIVKLTNVGLTRGAVLGNIHIYPLQYNPGALTVRKYNRILVRVNFGSRDSRFVSKSEDDLLSGVGINFESAKNWFISQPILRKQSQVNSVLASGVWYRFQVTEDGIYKITGSQLLTLGIPATTDPATIRIFSNGGEELPLDPISYAADDLLENSVYLSDAGTTGRLDAQDFIAFFGKGTKGWKYNSAEKKFSHYINRFAEPNIYWLTYGGAQSKRMQEVQSLNLTNVFEPTTIISKIFREDEKVNLLSSGLEWLGQQFSVNDIITYIVSLPGLDFTAPINYNVQLAARAHQQRSFFSVFERDQKLSDVSIDGTYIGGGGDQAKFATARASRIPTFTEPRSELKIKFTSNSSSGLGYLDWFEIFYSRGLTSQNDIFSFHTQDTTAVAKYNIIGFSSNDIQVFDVSEFQNAKVVTSPVMANSVTFQLQLNSGMLREIYAVGPTGYKTVSNLTKVNNQNLHGVVSYGDSIQFIIISHSEFKNAANRLKNHREGIVPDRLRTLVVDVDEIYNEFGGGLSSPMAIRNFLKFAYYSLPAQTLKYVLLLGDGDYDYKRITTSGPNWIPAWETPESYTSINSYVSEDPFVAFDNSGRVFLAVGRLAIRSLTEANAVVDKIIDYEKNPVRDPWKMRATFVADDGPAAGYDEGSMHTDDAESVVSVTPNSIEQRKIYIVEYPTVVTSVGRRKPTANQAIVKQINDGTLLLNFNGHGNPRLWTHEQVFVRETDFPLLQNKNKYFFLVAATCNFSQFDGTGDQSGGEILVNKPNSGAIGVFAATRAVSAPANRVLNMQLYREIFRFDAAAQLIPQRFGDAVYRAKQIYNEINDRKFFLLGDPSVRIGLPKRSGTIDSINSKYADRPIKLQALQRVSLAGNVREPSSFSVSNFTGKAQVVVYDANKYVPVPEWPYFRPYKTSGGIIFKGESSISNGKFNSEFIIPKDISYDTLNGRITLYFWNEETDGMGYTENFQIDGTDTTAVNDGKGPEISIYFNARSFQPGDVVPEAPLLIADLKDESGINASGAGVGHRIEAWLDNQTESIDITPYYKSKVNTFQEGTVEYQFGKLTPGTHSIKIRAWDVFNNTSTNETIFDVLTAQGLKITDVYNYPNPFSASTIFTFHHNQIVSVDAEIKIYTIAGRLIQSIKESNINDKFVRIEWDGRDRDGDKLANGIYLYKVVLKTQDGRFVSEALGKISVLR
ncbi:MAG: type IX secretion system sortase PorU [Bacteroidota bacterium]|nr:type IX secretion system sortase PorU [Bacteroidota bacterium]